MFKPGHGGNARRLLGRATGLACPQLRGFHLRWPRRESPLFGARRHSGAPWPARRCTWTVCTELGSDHLPQAITATVSGNRPRRIRGTRWAFYKADWASVTAQCEDSMAALTAQETTVEKLSANFTEMSVRYVPRGAQNDPRILECDQEVVQAVRSAERREPPCKWTRPTRFRLAGGRRRRRRQMSNWQQGSVRSAISRRQS